MRIPLLLLGLALAVRAALVAAFPDPAYPDASYYAMVARSIAGGDGLNVPFVWIFAEMGNRIPAIGELPVPSNAHWLPLASLLQAPFVSLLGPTGVANAVSGVLVGALAAPLTWAIARDAGVRPGVATGAGVIAAIPGPLFAFMGQPENFGLVHVLAAASLWLCGRGLRAGASGSGAAAFAGAGLFAGLVALARNDGILLAGTIAIVWLLDRVRWLRRRRGVGGWARVEDARPVSLAAAVGSAVGFLVVMVPWWLRQLATFGSISPTSSSGTALWVRDMRDWSSTTSGAGMAAFFAQGWAAILASRVAGLGLALATFIGAICGVVLAPFVLVGALVRGREPAFRPWLVYAVVLTLGAAIVFPVHIPGGAYIHSAIGLMPHATVLGLDALARLADRLTGGRVRSDRALAAPVALATALVVALGLATAPGIVAGWAEVRDPRVALRDELDARGVPMTDRLLTLDAAGTSYWTGRPSVVTPDDPIATLEQVARAYSVRWLIVEPREVVPAIRDAVASDAARPSWIGPAVVSISGAEGAGTLVLYPVCTEPGDDRCAPLPGSPATGASGAAPAAGAGG